MIYTGLMLWQAATVTAGVLSGVVIWHVTRRVWDLVSR